MPLTRDFKKPFRRGAPGRCVRGANYSKRLSMLYYRER